MKRMLWILLMMSGVFNLTFAQFKDSISHQKFFFSHWSAPKKASVLSAFIPGAGQVFNKKYWKIPVIYGIGGILAYNAIAQTKNYIYYKSQLLNVLNGGTNPDGLSQQQLVLLKNQSKKWRDLSVAGIVLIYVLNIIDANVDAHLKTFDVSDNLSLNIQPSFGILDNTEQTFIYAKNNSVFLLQIQMQFK